MAVITSSIRLNTRGFGDAVDITQQVEEALRASHVEDGIVTLFCPSSTSALTTIEYESGCVQDLKRLFEKIVPQNDDYAHNNRWGDGNGFSHVRAALLKASLTVPFVKRKLTLGTWQQVIYVDFDNRTRQREIIVQIIGE